MTTLTSSKKTAIFTRKVFHFKASVLDLFGRSCPGEEVGNAILLVSLVSDVRFPRVLGQARSSFVRAGHVVAQMRSRGNKSIP